VKPILRHIDKIVVAILAILLGLHVYVNYRDLQERTLKYARDISDARTIEKLTEDSEIRIPPKNSDLHSGDVKKRWQDLPTHLPFTWKMFYPRRK